MPFLPPPVPGGGPGRGAERTWRFINANPSATKHGRVRANFGDR